MSSADESQSSGGSSDSDGNNKRNIDEDNRKEKKEIEKQKKEEVNEEVEQPESGVLLSYIFPNLSLQTSEIDKLRKDDLKKLLEDKKLILVLVLDYTLINSVLLGNLTDKELGLLDVVDRPDHLFQLDKCSPLVKMRPYIHDFLKEANNLFEMYLTTTRQHDFAFEVAAHLDPDNAYFPSRVICRPDNTTRIKNGLNAGLGVENVVIILDDTEEAWEDHKENLIVLEKYKFFTYTEKSLSERGRYESKSRGTLESILHVLKQAHKFFYDPKIKVDLASRDIRVILDKLKKSILGGCNIMFIGVFSSNVQPDEQHIWKLAEAMGASCSTDLNDSVTHVVVAEPNIIIASWAIETNRFVVTTHWIVDTHYLWRRQDEENYFPVQHKH